MEEERRGIENDEDGEMINEENAKENNEFEMAGPLAPKPVPEVVDEVYEAEKVPEPVDDDQEPSQKTPSTKGGN